MPTLPRLVVPAGPSRAVRSCAAICPTRTFPASCSSTVCSGTVICRWPGWPIRASNCKITGADFSQCRDFGLSFSFSGCILDYSVFHGKKLKNIRFEDCSLTECDFTQADLTKASFIQCRLDRAVFSRTNLSGADFTSASGFSIDPENNRMTKARFSAGSLAGLLDKYGLVIR